MSGSNSKNVSSTSGKKILAIAVIVIIVLSGIAGYIIVSQNRQTQNSNLILGLSMLSLLSPPAPVGLQLLWSYDADHPTKAISISPDGNYIAVVCENESDDILLFLTSEKELLWNKSYTKLFPTYSYGSINNISVSNNGDYIAVSSHDKTHLIYGNSTEIWTWDNSEGDNYAAISDNGNYIAVASQQGKIHLLDSSRNILWNYTTSNTMASVSISGNGTYIAAGDNQGYVYLRDKDNNTILEEQIRYSGNIRACLTPQGDYIGVGFYEFDYFGLLNSSGDWVLNWTSAIQLNAIAMPPGGELLYLAIGRDIKVYNAVQETYTGWLYVGENVVCIDTNSDGSYIVAGSGNQIHLLQII